MFLYRNRMAWCAVDCNDNDLHLFWPVCYKYIAFGKSPCT